MKITMAGILGVYRVYAWKRDQWKTNIWRSFVVTIASPPLLLDSAVREVTSIANFDERGRSVLGQPEPVDDEVSTEDV